MQQPVQLSTQHLFRYYTLPWDLQVKLVR